MGRPPTRPKRLKDGFYIEVRNKGANSGMKIRSDDRPAMQMAADFYSRNKEVVVLGEHKDDVWMNEKAEQDKVKQDKRDQKAREKEIIKKAKKAAKPPKVAKLPKAATPPKAAKSKKEAKPKKVVKPKKAVKTAKKKK